MDPVQFGNPERLLFGFHHSASGLPKRTGVLICGSWGTEHMRCYRGVRAIAQRMAAAGFETLRFDYSGTGDSQGHALDARFEHWLADIAAAARELRDLSGADHIAMIGIRFGALLVEAVRQQQPSLARLNVLWDSPASGVDYIQQMQTLADGVDAAKRWRRSRNMQLPPPDAYELYGHAWPAALAQAVAQAQAADALGAKLWVQSSDEPAPATAPAEAVFATGEASHWREVQWVHTPWAPVAAATRLAEHLTKVLP